MVPCAMFKEGEFERFVTGRADEETRDRVWEEIENIVESPTQVTQGQRTGWSLARGISSVWDAIRRRVQKDNQS